MNAKRKESGRKAIQFRGTECLNCGHPLDKSDRYCPYCSQINSTKSVTLLDYFSEFLGSIFVYDSRLRYTLRDIFKPGKMSLNYVHGQRLKYANPFKFFLSISILYFIVNGFVNERQNKEGLSINSAFETSGSATYKTPRSFIMEDRGDTIRAAELGIEQFFSEKELSAMPFLDRTFSRAGVYLDYLYNHPEQSSVTALEQLGHPPNMKNKWIYSRMKSIKKIVDDKDGFFSYIQSNFPFFLFFFAPFFALFFLIFYRKTKFKYMDHLVLLFHIFSFYFLVNLIIRIPSIFIETSFFGTIFFLFVVPFYFYKSLRNFYGERFLKTIFKTILLGIIFSISIVIAILFFLAGSALSY